MKAINVYSYNICAEFPQPITVGVTSSMHAKWIQWFPHLPPTRTDMKPTICMTCNIGRYIGNTSFFFFYSSSLYEDLDSPNPSSLGNVLEISVCILVWV